MLKTYNKPYTEQLGLCTVKLRHRVNTARFRFFVVSGDGPALLGMPEIELLDILKTMCTVVEYQQADRTFDSQTMKPFSNLSYKVHTHWKSR